MEDERTRGQIGFWEALLGQLPPLLRFFALTVLVVDAAFTTALALLPPEQRFRGFVVLAVIIAAEVACVGVLVWRKTGIALAEKVAELEQTKEVLGSEAFKEAVELTVGKALEARQGQDHDRS